MFTHSFTLHVVVFIILHKKGKILLLKRKNTGHRDGEFGLPAGHKEANESLTDAVVREAREELGIKISKNDVSLQAVIDRNSQDRETLDFYFEVQRWDGTVINHEPEKCSELLWCSENNLPYNVINYVADSLKLIAQGKSYYEIGWEKPYK